MKRPLRSALIGIVLLALSGYGGATAFLAIQESRMVYTGAGMALASRHAVPPVSVSFPWDSLRVTAQDGVPVFLVESRISEDAPWVIFFHGNGGPIGSWVERYALLLEGGFNVLGVEYRGYGASSGAGDPSEQGLYADARAGLRYLIEQVGVPPERIVTYGHSLGSGLATQLAVESAVAGVITEGAFTALPDVGQEIYPWLPISLVMRNRFENIERAPSISVPWLVLHARDDRMIPFRHGEALAAAAPAGRLVPLAGGHADGVLVDRDLVLGLLRELAESAGPVS